MSSVRTVKSNNVKILKITKKENFQLSNNNHILSVKFSHVTIDKYVKMTNCQKKTTTLSVKTMTM